MICLGNIVLIYVDVPDRFQYVPDFYDQHKADIRDRVTAIKYVQRMR